MIPTPKIVEQFNEAIKHLQRAIDASTQGDLSKAQTELGKSSGCIYSSLEWCFKNFLLHKFPDPSKNAYEHSIINGFSFHKKFSLFQLSVTPNFQTKGIDPKIISELRDNVRNQPEHSGYIPHYASLVKVISETKKIISIYIDNNAALDNIPNFTPSEIEEDSNWSEFYTSCDSFNKGKNSLALRYKSNIFN